MKDTSDASEFDYSDINTISDLSVFLANYDSDLLYEFWMSFLPTLHDAKESTNEDFANHLSGSNSNTIMVWLAVLYNGYKVDISNIKEIEWVHFLIKSFADYILYQTGIKQAYVELLII
jgi:hypothetical protein